MVYNTYVHYCTINPQQDGWWRSTVQTRVSQSVSIEYSLQHYCHLSQKWDILVMMTITMTKGWPRHAEMLLTSIGISFLQNDRSKDWHCWLISFGGWVSRVPFWSGWREEEYNVRIIIIVDWGLNPDPIIAINQTKILREWVAEEEAYLQHAGPLLVVGPMIFSPTRITTRLRYN
jgi:hypothetical protein